MRNLFAQFLGRPVIEAVLWLVGKARARAYSDVEGRHYQFRAHSIDIIEGLGSELWLSISDVRRTVTHLPTFPSLRKMYPLGVRQDEGDRTERIEAGTLVSALDKAHDIRTRRFVVWLRREVIFPAEKKAYMRGAK